MIILSIIPWIITIIDSQQNFISKNNEDKRPPKKIKLKYLRIDEKGKQ